MTTVKEKKWIAGYCRISIDEELDKDNVSIENQKLIISDYVNRYFPDHELIFYEDRDKSGYTFEQREGYQMMRQKLINNAYDMVIIKDFSRFSRRNSYGLVELETLRDYGVRIISIGDNVDYPKNDEWLNIQFRFLMNELPVTDTSKKVREVVRRKQEKGEWICNAPYGYYIHPLNKNKIFVDKEGADVVKLIFKLYNEGYGYKKIANLLTENKLPTGRCLMVKQLSERGYCQEKLNKIIKKTSDVWSHVSVSKIITNDFYIGTLRQRVWKRKGINKADVRTEKDEQLIFENHHEAIIDIETFKLAQENYSHRSITHYKGNRKYEHPYSGYLFCEECGSPMFSISNPKRPPGYICGRYHRRGLKGCTSHHIQEKEIDSMVRIYLKMVMDTFKEALISFDTNKNKECSEKISESKRELAQKLERVKLELVECNKMRLKQVIEERENQDIINEAYDTMQKSIVDEIQNIELQISYLSSESEKRTNIKNNISSVLKTFDFLISKEHFSAQDVAPLINKNSSKR